MDKIKDPVCGMTVEPPTDYSSQWQGKEVLFCSANCKRKFDADPPKYASPAPAVPAIAASKPDFTPLFLIFGGIAALAALKYFLTGESGIGDAMLDFMGVFFVVFAGFKLLDLNGFADAYSTYDILAKKNRTYALIYPFLELTLGVSYLIRWNVEAVNWAAFVLMAISSVGVIQALKNKRKIQCACLGTKIKLPMTKITLFEDILMALMASSMILFVLPLFFATSAFAEEDHSHHAVHQAAQSQAPTPGMKMNGMLGQYPMTREASGTAWQPDSSPHEGIHLHYGEWTGMLHGFANFIYTDQGGPRGGDDFFSTSMLMVMANRPLGPGTWGLKGMLSLDPEMGDEGYPLLLQTGETAAGHHLIDRQHPHDLFMELATTYSMPVGEDSSVFGYFGFPGEPALGPPAFMHRFSGIDNPEAPISHHWLDSTHITFGVVTLGYIWKNWKLEGSVFTGREPDESRWNFDSPQWDSYSTRLTYNFSPDWSAQVSYGSLHSPEELSPEIDQERVTASITYNKKWDKNNWQTTFAWGRNMNDPGDELDAFLLESSINIAKTHTFFGRVENTDKNELFDHHSDQYEEVFNVSKMTLGYIYDFPEWHQMQWGVGGSGSVHFVPDDLDDTYGDTPTSYMVFARVKI